MITPLPAPPSRQDPNHFAERADALLAALMNFVTEANELQVDVNENQTLASSAATGAQASAGAAASARDIALAAANYKGAWSVLAGALAIPATVLHNNSIWMLKESVANVALETPGVSSKWMNVTPANGLGSAAYRAETDFQPAIGALSGLMLAVGDGTISAATAAQIVAAIGASPVARAALADRATAANSADAIADGAVDSAVKIANRVVTWAKMAAMSTARLIGRSSAGDGSPEEITIGAGLSLSNGQLACTVTPPVVSVNGKTGPVVLSPSDVGAAAAAHTHAYADLTAVVAVALIVNGTGGYAMRFTRANGATFDVITGSAPGTGSGS